MFSVAKRISDSKIQRNYVGEFEGEILNSAKLLALFIKYIQKSM